MRRILLAALLLVAATLVLVGWYTKPPPVMLPGGATVVPIDQLDSMLAQDEASADSRWGLIDGTEKRILWYGEPATVTPFSVVYLHGFSATRQEVAPAAEHVAAAIGANLFETRLTAHGRQKAALHRL